MKLIVEVLKPENKANASVPLTKAGAMKANYAKIANKKRERNNGYFAARRALYTVPNGTNFVPRGYRIVWPYKTVCPDADNIVARMKAVLDGCAMAFNVNDRDFELLGVKRVKVTKSSRTGLELSHVYIEFETLTEETQ